MNFTQAIKTCLGKYATFAGRAARSEYWYWQLLFFVSYSLFFTILPKVLSESSAPIAAGIGLAVFLGLLLPNLAVAARRLHDNGMSGWWMLIVLTIVGIIPYVFLTCRKGDFGDNSFGPDPLAGTPGHGPRTQADLMKTIGYTIVYFVFMMGVNKISGSGDVPQTESPAYKAGQLTGKQIYEMTHRKPAESAPAPAPAPEAP